MSARLRAGLAARATHFGELAVAGAVAALAARIATAAPDIGTQSDDAEVRLVAPGLKVRVFGSRKRAADVRLLAMIGGQR